MFILYGITNPSLSNSLVSISHRVCVSSDFDAKPVKRSDTCIGCSHIKSNTRHSSSCKMFSFRCLGVSVGMTATFCIGTSSLHDKRFLIIWNCPSSHAAGTSKHFRYGLRQMTMSLGSSAMYERALPATRLFSTSMSSS